MTTGTVNRVRRRRSRLLARDDSGAALIEFALSAVVFLMTILGTMEFGIAIWRYNMVSDLAQEGARWAAVHGLRSSAPANAGQVQTFIQNRATGIQIASVNVSSPAGVTGVCNPTGPSVNPGTLLSGVGICVTVSAVYQPLSGLIPQATMTLRSTAKMVMAR